MVNSFVRYASLTTAIAIAALLASPLQAAAADAQSTVQQMIDQHLVKYPGGHQINATELSYDNGRFVITFVKPPNAKATADCPSGSFCIYDGINYVYPRSRLSSCGWYDLAWRGWNDRTESVHFNISSGSVTFENHAAGSSDHNNDVVLFSVNTTTKRRADLGAHRNKADHVFRYC